jgi:hypothetical protein
MEQFKVTCPSKTYKSKNHPKVVLAFLGSPRWNRTTDTRIFKSSDRPLSLGFQELKPPV